MNTQEIFKLLDDWQSVRYDMLEESTRDAFELGRSAQLQSCIDQLLAVVALEVE